MRAIVRELSCQTVRLPRFLQCKNEPHQFLGSVRDGNIVVLALGPFLGEIGGEGWIPMTDKLGSVKERVSQVSGSTLFHVGVTV